MGANVKLWGNLCRSNVSDRNQKQHKRRRLLNKFLTIILILTSIPYSVYAAAAGEEEGKKARTNGAAFTVLSEADVKDTIMDLMVAQSMHTSMPAPQGLTFGTLDVFAEYPGLAPDVQLLYGHKFSQNDLKPSSLDYQGYGTFTLYVGLSKPDATKVLRERPFEEAIAIKNTDQASHLYYGMMSVFDEGKRRTIIFMHVPYMNEEYRCFGTSFVMRITQSLIKQFSNGQFEPLIIYRKHENAVTIPVAKFLKGGFKNIKSGQTQCYAREPAKDSIPKGYKRTFGLRLMEYDMYWGDLASLPHSKLS